MWLLIGKVALAIWLTLTPEEQVNAVEIVAYAYKEQMSCYKAEVLVLTDEENVYIVATCQEKEV